MELGFCVVLIGLMFSCLYPHSVFASAVRYRGLYPTRLLKPLRSPAGKCFLFASTSSGRIACLKQRALPSAKRALSPLRPTTQQHVAFDLQQSTAYIPARRTQEASSTAQLAEDFVLPPPVYPINPNFDAACVYEARNDIQPASRHLSRQYYKMLHHYEDSRRVMFGLNKTMECPGVPLSGPAATMHSSLYSDMGGVEKFASLEPQFSPPTALREDNIGVLAHKPIALYISPYCPYCHKVMKMLDSDDYKSYAGDKLQIFYTKDRATYQPTADAERLVEKSGGKMTVPVMELEGKYLVYESDNIVRLLSEYYNSLSDGP
eukprot:GHVQ01022670.1.p1 GENE.GHVQ01022670.1~~GHVQ01022670.1.p1  ORF type:complete len:319 (+),score=37.78 GHVQ01022670.1:1716-2672(+)